jgi:hypothetical protein
MKAPLGLVVASCLFAVSAHGSTTVPGTSNPWLAGQPDGATAAGGDSAPTQSPVLVERALTAGEHLVFVVTGSVNNDSSPSGLTPDGGGAQGHGAENGLAGQTTNINSLIGVFLDDTQPANPAPSDFSSSTSAAVIAPGLRQPFFIGDGLTGTGSGERQQFVVPAGATRLFLGTMDGFGWYNNFGSFEVEVSNNCVAPPGAIETVAWPILFGEGHPPPHYYSAILVPDGLTWDDAKSAAETLGGHLVTVTSAAENDFVFSLVSSDDRFWFLNEGARLGPWLGAFQPDGSSEPDGGWSWVTNEDFSYTNWAAGEPNNSGGGENRLHFFSPDGTSTDKLWNDASSTGKMNGYIVEFDSGPPIGHGLVAWWPGDDNARDVWSGNHGTRENGATFGSGEVGRAFAFDGVNDYVFVPGDGIDIAGTSGAFSIDAWIFPVSSDSNPIVEWSREIASGGAGNAAEQTGTIGVHFWQGYGCLDGCGARGANEGALYANIVDLSGGSHFVSTDGGVIPLNTWSHVALTYTPSTGHAIIYVNGRVERDENIGTVAPQTSLDLNIGARTISDGGCTGAGCFFGGNVDEVELFDRALTAHEVMSIFNAGATGKCKPECVVPPDDLIGWWPGDGTAGDFQGANHGDMENGATFAPGFVDQAFSLDGINDYVRISTDATLDFENSDFTIDAWIKTSAAGIQMIYASAWNFNPSAQLELDAESHAEFFIRDNDGDSIDVVGTSALSDGKWHHVTGIREGITAHVYVDGVEENSNTNEELGTISLVCSFATIGGRRTDAACAEPANEHFFHGLIDEVEVFKRALSTEEIMSIFAARTAGKCKPEQSDVSGAFVNKNRTFTQTSEANPAPANDGLPFDLVVGVDATGPDNVASASFIPPGGATTALSHTGSAHWSFENGNYASAHDLNAAYANGDYTFDIQIAHVPFQFAPVITINGDEYPDVPKISNTNWTNGALDVDPTQDFTFQWNDFCDSCTAIGACTCVTIADRPSIQQSAAPVTETPYVTLHIDVPGGTSDDQLFSPDTTSFVLPAKTLQPNQTYHAYLQFANLRDRNENGAQLSSQYATITNFDIVTGTQYAPGPVSPFYITAGQQGIVAVTQVADVKFTFNEHHPDTPGQYAIAVLDTVRIMGAFLEGNYTVGSEYSLEGVFTGHDFPFAVQGAGFWDGASDGTHNYAVDYNNGGVYRFDSFWENPQLLFSTAKHYLGITFDTSNNTLWISQWDNGVVEHRSLNGNLLSSFSVPFLKATCLALDPADGTLWMGSQLNLGTFSQFAQDGTPISTRAYPQLANLNTLGGEFPVSSGGEPTPTPTPTPTPGATPKLSISVTPATVSEGNEAGATFTITASNAPGQDLSVNFITGGKAQRGSDYTLNVPNNQVTLFAGTTSASINLFPIPDHVAENTEKATVILQSGTGYKLGKQGKKATVKIQNAP